jgi:uncharacterized membrane-anchored protein
MRLSLGRRERAVAAGSELRGPARVDTRTKSLTRRLRPGDIAVIDHLDLDRVSAEALVQCRPGAVLNAARSTSGRYPNLGPAILSEAGIPLIDDLGPGIMSVADGRRLVVDGGTVRDRETVVAEGVRQTAETIEAATIEARSGLSDQLESFAANTMDYLRRERALLLDGVGVPEVRTPIAGRHALIVVRGYHYKEDLRTLRPYVKEYRPVLIGVDGGADAILEEGWKPHMIVGDMDSVSDKALLCGAEIIVHAYRDGRAPGLERVERLDVPHVIFPATGTSEDVAMLLADDKDAELIVAVGTHATLVEFLDKGRSGMASTFLTRLRVGAKLVDAKGVSRLYQHRVSNVQVAALLVAGIGAVIAALAVTPAGQTMFGLAAASLDDFLSAIRHLVGAW